MYFDNCPSAGILSQINSLLNYIYLRFSNNLSWTVCDSSFGRILSLKEFNFSSLGLNFRERGVQYHGAPLRTDKMEKEPLVKFTQLEFFMCVLAKKEKEAMLLCIVVSWPRSSNYVVNDLPRFYLIRIIINQIMLERDLHKNNE